MRNYSAAWEDKLAFHADFFCRDGVRKRKALCVEHDSLVGKSAVERVAENWKLFRSKMHADLVRATSERTAFHEETIGRNFFEHRKFRPRGKPAVFFAHPAPLRRLTFRADSPERKVNRE